jgi:hypothetical protein
MTAMTIITLTQSIGEDHVIFDLKFDSARQLVLLERTEVGELHKLEHPKTVFILAQAGIHQGDILCRLLVDILIGIMLENGATHNYRSTLSLRNGNVDDASMRNMIKSMDELSVRFKHPAEFEKLQADYKAYKTIIYDTVLSSYTYMGATYDEYRAHENEMLVCLERMVRSFVSMNLIS